MKKERIVGGKGEIRAGGNGLTGRETRGRKDPGNGRKSYSEGHPRIGKTEPWFMEEVMSYTGSKECTSGRYVQSKDHARI